MDAIEELEKHGLALTNAAKAISASIDSLQAIRELHAAGSLLGAHSAVMEAIHKIRLAVAFERSHKAQQ